MTIDFHRNSTAYLPRDPKASPEALRGQIPVALDYSPQQATYPPARSLTGASRSVLPLQLRVSGSHIAPMKHFEVEPVLLLGLAARVHRLLDAFALFQRQAWFCQEQLQLR